MLSSLIKPTIASHCKKISPENTVHQLTHASTQLYNNKSNEPDYKIAIQVTWNLGGFWSMIIKLQNIGQITQKWPATSCLLRMSIVNLDCALFQTSQKFAIWLITSSQTALRLMGLISGGNILWWIPINCQWLRKHIYFFIDSWWKENYYSS